jgi:3-oxoacyl-[acyl-carrier-protein] synthase II
MTKRVAITGMGVISSLGNSPAELHSALCDGRTGLHKIAGEAFHGFHCGQAGDIAGFEAEIFLPGRPLRPLDRTGRLVTAAATLALANSGWNAEALGKHDVGLVLGTMFGSVHTISEFDRRALVEGVTYVSPMDFANTVINAAAGQAAIWHNLRGINSTIAAGAASGLVALSSAADLIRHGCQTAVLAGGADEFCFESFCGFERAGLLCAAREDGEFAIPFDARRTGFALAEATALLMLEEWDAAGARGAQIVGEIVGYGSAYDPARGDRTRSRQNGKPNAILRAIRAATEDAEISPSEIGCVSASANGSIAADKTEAFAIQTALNGNAAKVLVTTIKSMLGEALGASGALQAIDVIESLHSSTLPPIAGLEQTETDMPELDFCRQARKLPEGCALGLVNSMSFDGHACALLIRKPSAYA